MQPASSLHLSATLVSFLTILCLSNSISPISTKSLTLNFVELVPFANTCLLMRPKFSFPYLFFHTWTIVALFSLDLPRLSLTDKLQRIQNNAARLVFQNARYDHVTPLLESLQWLPISQRIDYKPSCLWNSVVTSTGPQYLADPFNVYLSSRQLRSSSDARIFRLPTSKTKHCGKRSFSFHGPLTWNKLPHSVRHSSASATFRSPLKSHLFKQ